MSQQGPDNDTVNASRPSKVMILGLAIVGVIFVLVAVYSKQIEAYLTAGSGM
ncbi:MAG: hypothetical protein RL477_1981 [Pseudomonadota bacterium]|jgi:hypothetical protein